MWTCCLGEARFKTVLRLAVWLRQVQDSARFCSLGEAASVVQIECCNRLLSRHQECLLNFGAILDKVADCRGLLGKTLDPSSLFVFSLLLRPL